MQFGIDNQYPALVTKHEQKSAGLWYNIKTERQHFCIEKIEVRFPALLTHMKLPRLWACPQVFPAWEMLEESYYITQTCQKIISTALWAGLQGCGTGKLWKQHEKRKRVKGAASETTTRYNSIKYWNAVLAAGSHTEGPQLPTLLVFAGLQHWHCSLFFSSVSSGCGAGSVA